MLPIVSRTFLWMQQNNQNKGGERLYTENTQNLTAVLHRVQENGVLLYLEGQPADPVTIADRCVREDETYMADYVTDETGRLRELRYDRITDL